MFNQAYLLKHYELFQYVIGISHDQFQKLLPVFTSFLFYAEHSRRGKKRRLRMVGGGRKATLKTVEQKLFFILFYYKVYPTFRFAQVIFGFDKRNVQLWVRRLEKVLFQTLGKELELPFRQVRHMDDWLETCPDLQEFLVDATERLIQRPKGYHKQKKYYSGKKKHHTVKNQLIVSPRTKRILAVSKTVEGKRGDKLLFDQEKITLYVPPDSTGMADKGYEGTQKCHPFLKMIIPKRKPKGKELTMEEKENNKQISSIRVQVEHPISYLKHFNILSHKFRSRVERSDIPFQTISALYNFTRPPS